MPLREKQQLLHHEIEERHDYRGQQFGAQIQVLAEDLFREHVHAALRKQHAGAAYEGEEEKLRRAALEAPFVE